MSEHLTEWQPIESSASISGFSDTEISLYQQVAENNEKLRKKVQELEAQISNQKTESWLVFCVELALIFGVGMGIGWFFSNYFFTTESYYRGYSEGREEWREAYCLLKHSKSVSAYNSCIKTSNP